MSDDAAGPPAQPRLPQQQPPQQQPSYPPGYAPPGYPHPGYGQPGYAPAPGPYYPVAYSGQPPMSPGDERTWAVLAHIGGMIVPFAWLIIYLVYKDRSAFVRQHACEASNFHLSVLIYEAAAVVVSIVLAVVTLGLGLILIIPVLIGGAIFVLVQVILAAVAAGQGRPYRYPMTIRMIH